MWIAGERYYPSQPVNEESLTLEHVAKLAGVAPALAATWVEGGDLPTERGASGESRVRAAVLRAFLIDRGMPVPRRLIGLERVLMIDDDSNILRATARMLKHSAPELCVELAEDPREALVRIQMSPPDAVVVDAYMPGLGGPEVCARIKTQPETAHVLVIAITGDSSPELRAAFAQAGAIALLEKPVQARTLLDALALDAGGHGSDEPSSAQ